MTPSTAILSKLGALERNLQELKVDLFFGKSFKQKQKGIYRESDILREVRTVRKQLWNEKYAKIVAGIH
ncbi:MAG: hypothetical protein HYS52_01475 [Candidatus Wildermuthbacteria bacterium]|nr:hypothetical protein [Candidatus Wildermuthbacteria bacterium]